MENELKALLDRACTVLATAERLLSSSGAHIEARECRQTIGSITSYQMKQVEQEKLQKGPSNKL